jgi:hypothetical protein
MHYFRLFAFIELLISSVIALPMYKHLVLSGYKGTFILHSRQY